MTAFSRSFTPNYSYLLRHASDVDTRPADPPPLHQPHLGPVLRRAPRRGDPAAAAANHEKVEMLRYLGHKGAAHAEKGRKREKLHSKCEKISRNGRKMTENGAKMTQMSQNDEIMSKKKTPKRPKMTKNEWMSDENGK
jgi:hypothetical protein